ncbi:MAG: hypothetical protein AAGJ82_05235 [Bacteroidota bacterium]
MTTRQTLLLAICCYLCTAWHAVGWHQGDEHFQILEFAAYKAGAVHEAELAWEFRERMRPAFQPFLAYVGYQVLGGAGVTNPFTLALLLRLLTAGFFLGLAWLLYRRYSLELIGEFWRVNADEETSARGWQRALLCLLLFHWCGVYSGLRFSGENWSGLLLTLGFVLHPATAPSAQRQAAGIGPSFGIGWLLGFAFLCRYQVALLVVGLLLWLLFIARERWGALLSLCLGGLLAVGLGILLDYWLYGEWVLSAWNYLAVNLLEGKAASYGTLPWWGYFKAVFEKGVPPLSLLYIGATLYFCYRFRRHPITWMWVPFLLVHCLLSRKDVRFLFPLLPLLPVVLVFAGQAFYTTWVTNTPRQKWWRNTLRFCWIVNLGLLLTVLVRPLTSEVRMARSLYHRFPEGFTLYAPDRDLYSFAYLEAKFYQRPHRVSVRKWQEELYPITYPAGTILYVEKSRDPAPPLYDYLLYTNRPAWLEPFNFNGWLDELAWWHIYVLEE